ncbi:hypothetical protein DVR12_12715 [Chitinophaga silvatica]|uniref:Lipoprotein n=1 Tax=Chitinophaga silvatica TaxID=2282649 RepID=A0A3E1YAE9_9BACT|nr:DUF6452 family protein [Chitinophaga silvatica]RFS22652.1 hypothetical protein DVR12_12715 [Chitinophaga silvatica]
MKRIYQILLVLSLSAVFFACENETKVCDQTLRNDLHIHFSRDSAGIVRDTVMPKVTLYALNRDSIYKQQPLKDLFLQLSPLADSSVFYLKVDSALVADTLIFRYQRIKHFISPGCGFGTNFLIDTVITTKNTIDSVVINNKSVISSNDTHLTLFFFNQ